MVLNVLAWRLHGRDAPSGAPTGRLPAPSPRFPAPPAATPVVSRVDYTATGFTSAHLGDAVLHGWYTPSGLAVEISRQLAAGEPFVYAYYDGVDRIAHACGLGEHYEAELPGGPDRMVG